MSRCFTGFTPQDGRLVGVLYKASHATLPVDAMKASFQGRQSRVRRFADNSAAFELAPGLPCDCRGKRYRLSSDIFSPALPGSAVTRPISRVTVRLRARMIEMLIIARPRDFAVSAITKC